MGHIQDLIALHEAEASPHGNLIDHMGLFMTDRERLPRGPRRGPGVIGCTN